MSRAERARKGNDRIAARARQLRFVAPVPLLCECRAQDCEELVLLTLAEFHRARQERQPLLAPGH